MILRIAATIVKECFVSGSVRDIFVTIRRSSEGMISIDYRGVNMCKSVIYVQNLNMKKNEHTKSRMGNLLFLIASLSVFMMSCRQEPVSDVGTDVPMSFAAHLYEQYDQLSAASITKAEDQPSQTKSVTTLNGDNLGIYVVRGALDVSNPLLSQGNTYDNIQCPVSADGNLQPAQSMYYPTLRDYIDVYSYRPYDQNLANPNFIKWTLPTDQTAENAITDADFLFSKGHVAPLRDGATQVPVDLELKHALTLVHVTLTVPASFLDKKITSVDPPVIINTVNTARITIGDQYAEKYPQSPTADITPRLVESKEVDGNTLYLYECLLVPQAVAPGTAIFRCVVNYEDGTKAAFRYNISDQAFTLAGGCFQTLNLILSGYGVLELTSATIDKWTSEPVTGSISGVAVGNNFEMKLIEPTVDYVAAATIKGVRMTIAGNQYTFSTTPPVVSGNKLINTVKVAFPADDNSKPLSYPFTIDKIEFLGESKKLLTAYSVNIEISAIGNVQIPLYAYSVITTTTSVTGWGTAVQKQDISYPDITVNNTYSVYYLNDKATSETSCKSVTKMVLTIGGKDVTIDGFKMENAANTQFAAISDAAIALPTGGNSPLKYSYTITKVALYNGDKSLVSKAGLSIRVYTIGKLGITIQQ